MKPRAIQRSFDNLKSSNLWWEGLTFLKELHCWTQKIDIICDKHLITDIKTLFNQGVITPWFNQSNVIVNIVDEEMYSSLNKLHKVTSLVKRYVNNLKRKIQDKNLRLTPFVTASELKLSIKSTVIWFCTNWITTETFKHQNRRKWFTEIWKAINQRTTTIQDQSTLFT